MTVKRNIAIGTGGAAVIAATVAFLPAWEGTDHIAKYDRIGTGHPLTWCHGQTSFDDPTVKPGQRFTDKECDAQLAEALPRYLNQIGPCIHRPAPIKVVSAVLDSAWNAGGARVCKSPMVARINAGDMRGACNAFDGWIIRSAGVVRPGLIDRRAGELHGDHRKSERALCLEGVNDPKSELYFYSSQVVRTNAVAPEPPKPAKHWWQR